MNASRPQLRVVPQDNREKLRAANRSNVSMRIELAALNQALLNGIENVTVDEVSLAAGVSRRNFYRYFRTIDDALSAMPRRELERLSKDLSARPLSENIFEALLNIAQGLSFTASETAVRKLANKVAERSPTAWLQMIRRSGADSSDVMEAIIADRLAATGQDPARAGLIAAVYLAVIGFVGRSNLEAGKYDADHDQLREALRDLSRIMREAFPD